MIRLPVEEVAADVARRQPDVAAEGDGGGALAVEDGAQIDGKVGVVGGKYSYSFKPTAKGKWRFVATYSKWL